MDLKVYKKETVSQPSGAEDVFVPAIIDIVPTTIEIESTQDVVENNVWFLGSLKRIADVEIRDHRLIINSDKVRFENGRLIAPVVTDEITDCEVLEDSSRELLEQECALATIFQRGLDPLDLNDGIRWSEAILEELSCLQLIQDIIEAVGKVSSSVRVVFDTIEGENGQQYLSYKLMEVV